MLEKHIISEYAPYERASGKTIQRQSSLIDRLPVIKELFNAIPDIVLILNEQRQIVFSNQVLEDALSLDDRQTIYGLRPGEALNCSNAGINPGGCGTSAFCRTCGAVNAIVSSLKGKKKTDECRISQKKTGAAFDLRVVGTPFLLEQEPFVIFIITDISAEKRKNVLERTFFHDINNTLTNIMGCTQLLPISTPEEQEDLIESLTLSTLQLQEEINSQKELIDAENGDLTVNLIPIPSLEFTKTIHMLFTKNELSNDKSIRISDNATDTLVVTDKTLLARVIGNMLKNALEASQKGDIIQMGCELDMDDDIRFWVSNQQFIPVDIQHQIFKRSFSTKGKGRGTGTYSIKLLTERYLDGSAEFSTSQNNGTVFSVTLPLGEMI